MEKRKLVNTSKNNWFSLLYVTDGKLYLALISITLVTSMILGYLTPIYISELFNSYDTGEFWPSFKMLAYILGTEYVIQVIYNISIINYVVKILLKVRMYSYSNWLNSYESISSGKNSKDQYPMGEVLARIINDTESLTDLVQSQSFKIIFDLVFIIACLVSLLKLNTTSGIILIAAEIFLCFFLIKGAKYMGIVFTDVRRSISLMSRTIANLTTGFRDTFYTPHGGYATKKGEYAFDDFLKKQLKANVYDAGYYSIAESLFPLLLVLLVLIFPYSNITEMAILAAIIDLIQRSINPIKSATSKVSNFQRAKSGIVKLVEFNKDVLKLPSSLNQEKYELKELKKFTVQVDEFTYDLVDEESDNQFKLSDIKFTGKPGELIGIVGLSGSGKSTLLKILATDIICPQSILSFEDQGGELIQFNGTELYEMQKFKQLVSIVSQDSHIFSESLKFNISMGVAQGFDEFWKECLNKIEYLKTWEINPEDMIDPKSISLGQKQLISALRSCFIRKPIVLFDEISSGLDSDLELALRKLVLLIQEYSLTIIVAHRVETIVESSKILVMDGGKLVDEGSHTDLISRSAVYQAFIKQISHVTH